LSSPASNGLASAFSVTSAVSPPDSSSMPGRWDAAARAV
jgi:hypothetical protein